MYARIVFPLMLCLVSATMHAGQAIDEQRPMSADGRFHLQAVSGDFKVQGSDDAQLVITGTLGTDVREMVIEGDERGWTLQLRPIENSGRLPRRTTSSRLTISLPRGAEISTSTISGNVEASRLNGRQVSVKSVSGSVRLEGVTPERLEVQTVSGEQRMDAGGVMSTRLRSVSGNMRADSLSGRISVNSVSGITELTGSQVEELDVETVSGRIRADMKPERNARFKIAAHSGNIALTLPKDTPLNLRANTFSGRITSDFGGEVQRGRGPGERLDHRSGDGNVEVESRSFSGNISIRQGN
jgi:DUF4097 and DUF4098 domain-containing protein YvlB